MLTALQLFMLGLVVAVNAGVLIVATISVAAGDSEELGKVIGRRR